LMADAGEAWAKCCRERNEVREERKTTIGAQTEALL
jgi:hypothetical protein